MPHCTSPPPATPARQPGCVLPPGGASSPLPLPRLALSAAVIFSVASATLAFVSACRMAVWGPGRERAGRAWEKWAGVCSAAGADGWAALQPWQPAPLMVPSQCSCNSGAGRKGCPMRPHLRRPHLAAPQLRPQLGLGQLADVGGQDACSRGGTCNRRGLAAELPRVALLAWRCIHDCAAAPACLAVLQ